MAVTEVVTELGSITQPTVSLHLRELVNVGLVRWRQVGSYHVHLVNRRAFTSLAARIQSLGGVQ
jgi:DNA-binding transcriptional ArsR family regulator